MQPERLSRRDFVRAVGLSAAGMAVERTLSASPAREGRAINLPREPGTYYEATVPDTLDLAERARLGINHFTSIISEEHDYEMYWTGIFDQYQVPVMSFQFSPLLACQAKAIEAMVMLRIMSGSQQNLEREAKMVEMMASLLGKDDGLYWIPKTSGRKPWLGPEEWRPFASVYGQARVMRAMLAWYQYTGDPSWKEQIDRMVDGFDRVLMVHKDDYGYFPLHGWIDEGYFKGSYVKGRGWRDTAEPTEWALVEGTGPQGYMGHFPDPLAKWYLLTGNKQALRLAGELVRFLIQPKFWGNLPNKEYPGVIGAEHAHWHGHFHGVVDTLRSILDYAIVTNDSRLKQFVRDGYEWTRQPVLARIGLVGDGQGCGCGRLIALAVKLSYAGVGDYWEDVDLYIRNHGTEMQFTPDDVPYLRSVAQGKPPLPEDPSVTSYQVMKASEGAVTSNGVMDATMGAFAGDPHKTIWWLCCTPHGNMGLFYAWDGTLRYANGMAQVNLLLSRASPWMDIDSYLPYEGKVVLRNKACREAFVRIPLWVDKRTIGCRMAGQPVASPIERVVRPGWFGRYLWFERLKAGDVVTIEFPMEERIERWTAPPPGPGPNRVPVVAGTVHNCRFRGNTVIEISPPIVPESPIYQDRPEKYKATKAPMREVNRFVTPLTLRW